MKLTDFDIENEPELPEDFRNSLKHTSDFDDLSVPYFDRLAVLVNEGIASGQEQRDYHKMIYENGSLATQAEAFKKCYLDPAERIAFNDKKSLRRRTGWILPIWAKTAAAAAFTGICMAAAARLAGNDPMQNAAAITQITRIQDNTPASNSAKDDSKKSDSHAGDADEEKAQAQESENSSSPKPEAIAVQYSIQICSNEPEIQKPAAQNPEITETDMEIMEAQEWMESPNYQAAQLASLEANEVGMHLMAAREPMQCQTGEPHNSRRQEINGKIKAVAMSKIHNLGQNLSRIKEGLASAGSSLANALPIKVKARIGESGKIDGLNIEGFSRTITYAR